MVWSNQLQRWYDNAAPAITAISSSVTNGRLHVRFVFPMYCCLESTTRAPVLKDMFYMDFQL